MPDALRAEPHTKRKFEGILGHMTLEAHEKLPVRWQKTPAQCTHDAARTNKAPQAYKQL